MKPSSRRMQQPFWQAILASGSFALLGVLFLGWLGVSHGLPLGPLLGPVALMLMGHLVGLGMVARRQDNAHVIWVIAASQIVGAILAPLWLTDIWPLGLVLLAWVPLQASIADNVERMPLFVFLSLMGAVGMVAAELFASQDRLLSMADVPSLYVWGTALGVVTLCFMAWLFWRSQWRYARLNLATQLALVFAAISAVSITVVAGILIVRTRTAQINDIGHSFQTLAETNAERTGNALENQVNALISLGHDSTVLQGLQEANESYTGSKEEIAQLLQERENLWQTSSVSSDFVRQPRTNRQAAELSRFRGINSFHQNLILTDRYGALVGAQGARPEHYAYHTEPWWQAAWDYGQGGVYLGQISIDPQSTQATLLIAVGVINPFTNQAMGVLASTYQLRNIQYDLGRTVIPSDGQLLLVDVDGTIIASPNQAANGTPVWPQLHQMMTATDGLAPWTSTSGWVRSLSPSGDPIILGHAPLNTSSGAKLDPLRILGWNVIVSATETNALAEVSRSVKVAVLFGLLMVLCVVMMAIVTARVVTRPVEALTITATAIATGDLDQRANPVGPVELVTLAEAFNTLTSRLRELIGGLQDQVAYRTAQLQASADVSRAATSVLDQDELVQQIVNLITDRFGFYFAAVYLLSEDEQTAHLEGASGEIGQALKARQHQLPVPGPNLVSTAIATRRPHIALDVGRDEVRMVAMNMVPNDAADTNAELVPHIPLLTETRSEIALPLIAGNHLLGALDVHSTAPSAFDESSAAVLQGMTDQLAIAIQNASLYKALAEDKQRMELLYRLGQELSTRLDPEQVYSAIHQAVMQLAPSEAFAIALLGEARYELEFVYLIDGNQRLAPCWLPVEGGLTGHVVLTGEPIMVSDFEVVDTVDAVELGGEGYVRSAVAVPIQRGSKVIGVLSAQSYRPHAYSLDDQQTLRTLASQAGIAIENARLYVRLQSANAELEEYNRTLEERVSQRTSELAHATTEAETARSAAEEANRAKSAFLANMSHELRTPLNSIINFTGFVLDEIFGPITDDQRKYLSLVSQSSEHLLGLINDILDLAKIEAGRMELFPEEIDLRDLINGVMATAVGLIRTKPIELHKEIDADLPAIHADRTRIRQVLLNLFSNAAKFTEAGHITVRAWCDDQGVTVSVEDTGIGIPAESIPKVFAEFEQVEGEHTRRTGGTGLGMPISKRFIEMHGGQMWVESEPGRGSTFYFTIPHHSQGDFPEPQTKNGHTPARVLVIDDDPLIHEVLSQQLAYGHLVFNLSDNRSPLETVRETRPDVVVLDVFTASGGGWRVLEELKSHPETRNIPVIGYSMLPDQRLAFPLSAGGYLVKPVGGEELRRTIARLAPTDGTVLAVDDDPNALEIIRHLLHDTDYQVITASDGKAGLEAARREKPDILVLDLMMPEMSGFEVLAELRADPLMSSLPVVVVTAKDLTVAERTQLQAQATALFQKGQFTASEFVTAIQNALHRAPAS